jgi:hypothetical protein
MLMTDLGIRRLDCARPSTVPVPRLRSSLDYARDLLRLYFLRLRSGFQVSRPNLF